VVPELETILDLVPALRSGPTRVTPLVHGLTNRNYRVDAGDESYVVRVSGANSALLGIDRDREHAWLRVAAAAGVGAEVVAFLPERGVLVTRFLSGRLLGPEDSRDPAVMRRVVEAVRRCHEGAAGPGSFCPFRTVREYHSAARTRGVAFPDTTGRALALLARIEQALGADATPCPCHNDLLPSNFCDDGATVRIIDWEYAGMGDRFFDLGNLAVNHGYDAEQERALLALYWGDIRSEHVMRLRLMRLASDMREAMWGFLQAGISGLDFDYAGYGRRHLERFLSGCRAHGIDRD
jgi:thiamine kinase-like enzyme